MITKDAETGSDKKDRYWGEERNERRRQRYETDANYRKRVQQQTRDTYRRLRQAMGTTLRDDDAADNIPLLGQIGEVRGVRMTDETRKDMLTFTVEEIAKALNRNQQVVYRWFAADMFPRPAVMASTERNRNQLVYTRGEAEAAMRVFSAHQKESQYYRERHQETRDKIFDAVYAARAALQGQGVVVNNG